MESNEDELIVWIRNLIVNQFLRFIAFPLLQIGAINLMGFDVPLTLKTYLGSFILILIMKCEFSVENSARGNNAPHNRILR
jgi:ACR3 family arsenite efflux pump ArsB